MGARRNLARCRGIADKVGSHQVSPGLTGSPTTFSRWCSSPVALPFRMRQA